ncbi:hypothetical protein HPB51_006739 [Rhipicephalus microplus]|uniref:Uncharacterized protein n=1 Tax=Rhipicephalus microplus TaxID=6941 RepID=A0A9J6E6V1_RHIMP|nr:hypothetical protein HPB51_006739 [Rhipicephalus microplus]
MVEQEALAALRRPVQLLQQLLHAQQQSRLVYAHQSSVLASTITPTGTTPCILIPPEFPEFWPGSPATWLLKMEAAFCLRNILQQERYAIMVDILPPSLRCVVPPPGPQPYDRLRDFVLALPQPTVPRHSLPAMRNVSIAPRAVTTPAPNPVAHSTSALLTIVPSTLPTSAAATPTTVPASTTAAPASLNFRASRFMPTSTPTDLPASIPAEAMSATEVLVDTAPVFLESTVVTTESAQPAGLTAPSLPSTASTETPSHGAPLNPCAGPFSLLVTSPVVSTTGLPNQEQSNAPTASTRARSTVPVEPRAQTLTFSPPEATSTASLPVTTDAPSSRFTETTINWTVATTSAQIYSGSDCSSRKEDPTGDDYGSICPWPSAAACGQGSSHDPGSYCVTACEVSLLGCSLCPPSSPFATSTYKRKSSTFWPLLPQPPCHSPLLSRHALGVWYKP